MPERGCATAPGIRVRRQAAALQRGVLTAPCKGPRDYCLLLGTCRSDIDSRWSGSDSPVSGSISMRLSAHAARAAALAALVASALLLVRLQGAAAASAYADAQVPVVIGSVECFVVRCPDGELSAADRVDHIYEVFVRHLGSAKGEFAVRKSPEKGSTKLQILINGDQVINVTSNDARAMRLQKPE